MHHLVWFICCFFSNYSSRHPDSFCKKGVLKNYRPATLLKKRFFQFCKIFNNTFFYTTSLVAAFEIIYEKRVTAELLRKLERFENDRNCFDSWLFIERN